MYDREVYHFLFLHFPIALFITGYIFHIFYLIAHEEDYKKFIFWMMGMGILWSIISIVSGYITAFEIERMNLWSDIFKKNHSNLMLISTIIFICLFFIRDLNYKILFFFHTVAIILLTYGAHLGAKWSDRI